MMNVEFYYYTAIVILQIFTLLKCFMNKTFDNNSKQNLT